jgi:surfeit locus 1 family protein
MTAGSLISRAGQAFRPLPALAAGVGVIILVSLGVWQVERLAWKQALLAQIAVLQSAPAAPVKSVLKRLEHHRLHELRPGQVDYVRVQIDCPTLEQTPNLRVYAVLGGVMGRRLVTACPLAGGLFQSILVDRGFSPDGAASGRAPSEPLRQPVIGVLRRAESRNWLTPPSDVAGNDWHSRDISAMAKALGAPKPAPVFLMLESPRPQDGGPIPAALPTDIPNNHLGYALTWFGLALGLLGVYVAGLVRAPASVADDPPSRV